MPDEVSGSGRAVRRARYLIPTQFPRRGELVAACAVLLLVAHLLLAQLTFLLALVFIAVSKSTRWRLTWLAVPAAAGIIWTLAIGPRAAGAGFAAGPAQILGYVGAHGLLHPHGAFAGAGSWLWRQAPLGLVLASAEAALVGWLDWLHADEWAVPPNRPGLAAAVRRAATVATIRAGRVVTRDGGNLGVAPATGARVGLSWAEVAGGVLFTGAAERDIAATSFQLVHAALRLRKPVITLDLSADPAVGSALAAACAAAGAPLRTFGTAGGCYEPFREGEPARRAEMLLALLGVDGSGEAATAGACVRAAFELIAAVPADPRTPVLDDVLHLLNPMAMRARLGLVPRDNPAADQIAEHVRGAVRLAQAAPDALTWTVRQIEAVRSSPAGQWLRPAGTTEGGIDLARVVRDRAAVLFRLDSAGLASLVAADLCALGADLRRIEVDGDGVVLLCGCEKLPAGTFARLVASGASAGLPVLATTTSVAAAAELAGSAGAVVIHRIADADATSSGQLAAHTGTRMVPAEVLAASSVPASLAAAVGRTSGPRAGTGVTLASVVPVGAGGMSAGGMGAGPEGVGAGPARAGLELVPQPAVPVQALRSLRAAQFVLAVSSPRRRLVELGRTVPGRLPKAPRAPEQPVPRAES
jgi:hypothetical protein